ncbi:transposase [Thermoflexus sp.]|uniref:transposase n=1 Tax=Thermoflexus sp. TaxID=1969742 RepID=UPI0035E44BD3
MEVSGIAWADEMRVGLIGQVRRVWAPRGVKIRQRLERCYEWAYLHLAVNGIEGKLDWQWTTNLKQEAVAEVVKGWKEKGIEVLIWDRAPSHRARRVRAVGVRLIEQPSCAPELNPTERVIEELRRRVEGEVYGDMEKKKAAIERELERWAADPERIRRLAGWGWIREAVKSSPTENTVFQ